MTTKKDEPEVEVLTREGVPLPPGDLGTGLPDVYVPAEDAPEAPSAPAHWYEPVDNVDQNVLVAKTLDYLDGQIYQHLRKDQHDEFTKELKAAL